MARVTWTDLALADLEAICLFIARDAPQQAALFANRIFNATDRLAEFPYLGRVVPEFGRNDIREVILQEYRLIYRLIGNEEVELLTFHHGARLVDRVELRDTND